MTTPVSNVRSIRPVRPEVPITTLGNAGWSAVTAALLSKPDAELQKDRFIRALADAGLSEEFLTVARHVGVL